VRPNGSARLTRLPTDDGEETKRFIARFARLVSGARNRPLEVSALRPRHRRSHRGREARRLALRFFQLSRGGPRTAEPFPRVCVLEWWRGRTDRRERILQAASVGSERSPTISEAAGVAQAKVKGADAHRFGCASATAALRDGHRGHRRRPRLRRARSSLRRGCAWLARALTPCDAGARDDHRFLA